MDYRLRGIPPALWRRVRDKAGDRLQSVLLGLLRMFADGEVDPLKLKQSNTISGLPLAKRGEGFINIEKLDNGAPFVENKAGVVEGHGYAFTDVTDDQIRALSTIAAEHNDILQAAICARALDDAYDFMDLTAVELARVDAMSMDVARRECLRVINDARVLFESLKNAPPYKAPR